MKNQTPHWWIPLLILVLALMWVLIAGCASTEHVGLDQTPADTAKQAGCDPLPLCDIPPAASSTQLTSALWACVLEYRAQFSKCYHLAKPAKVTAITVKDYCNGPAQGARYRLQRCRLA